MTDDIERQDAEERPDEDTDFDTDADESPRAAADWGLKKPKSGMGKEIKIGVTILVLICGIFGYVLYKNSAEATPEGVASEDKKSDDATPRSGEKSKVVQASSTTPPDETPQVPTTNVKVTAGQFPTTDRRPSAGKSAAYGTRAPTQNNEQPLVDDFDLMAEADALEDARNSKSAIAENDHWEDNTVAGQTSGGGNISAEDYNNFPPAQAEEFADSDDGEFTSLEDDTNPYEESPAADPFGENATTQTEPPVEQFRQDDLQQEQYNAQDFGDATDFAGEQDLSSEPTVGEQNPGAEDFGSLAESDYAETNDYASPLDVEMTGEVEAVETDAGFGEPQPIDPRTGSFQNVTRHTGRAGSTTIVRRTNESPLEPEQTHGNSTPVGDRVNGYRAVGSYQNEIENTRRTAAPDQIAPDQIAPDQFAPDQFAEGESDFNETGYVGSLDAVPSTADDNRTYGFDQQRRAEESLDTPVHSSGPTYIVESNDSFWSIARQTYGDAKYFQALAKYNQRTIPDPRSMRPGIEIATPTAAELESLYPELFGDVELASQHVAAGRDTFDSGGFLEDEEFRGRDGYGTGETISRTTADASGYFVASDGRPQYRVASGDNLGGIARRHLGKASRWEEIYRLNQDHLVDPNRLKIGTVLRLPDDARREEVVTRPTYGR